MEGDRLDEDQIALVIRRASELDGQSPAAQPGLDLVLLEEAAVEAGLSRESVRRAVAELRAGALAPELPASRRPGLGPGVVTVSRCVPGPSSAVDGILRRFLQKEQFQLRRDFGSSSSWTRRQDVPARVRVSLDKGVHRRLILREAGPGSTSSCWKRRRSRPGCRGSRCAGPSPSCGPAPSAPLPRLAVAIAAPRPLAATSHEC